MGTNNTNLSEPSSSDYFEAVATKVTMVSIIGNFILSAFKLLAGILAHSVSMVSDAIHSASDVFSSIIVIIGVKLSAREYDLLKAKHLVQSMMAILFRLFHQPVRTVLSQVTS